MFPACGMLGVADISVASQAELDHFHYLRRQTQARVLRSCSGEMEREVHSILGPLGVKETLSRLVAEDLRGVEDQLYIGGAADYGSATEGVMRAREGSGSSSGKKEKRGWFGWKKVTGAEERESLLEQAGEGEKGDEDMGLTAFLLKFGEGMGELSISDVVILERANSDRGSPAVQTVHIRPDYRSLLLPRRPHPAHSLHGECDRSDRPHHLELRHRRRALHLWRLQDVLHVGLCRY